MLNLYIANENFWAIFSKNHISTFTLKNQSLRISAKSCSEKIRSIFTKKSVMKSFPSEAAGLGLLTIVFVFNTSSKTTV